MGEVLKTSERACTVLILVGSTMNTMGWILQLHTLPNGWERYLKQARGPAQCLSWLEAPWSTMEWIVQLHPPPYCPSLHESEHCLPVCYHFNTKLKTCACVCVDGGGGGQSKKNIFLVKGNQVMEQWGFKSDPPDTVSDMITIPQPTF